MFDIRHSKSSTFGCSTFEGFFESLTFSCLTFSRSTFSRLTFSRSTFNHVPIFYIEWKCGGKIFVEWKSCWKKSKIFHNARSIIIVTYSCWFLSLSRREWSYWSLLKVWMNMTYMWKIWKKYDQSITKRDWSTKKVWKSMNKIWKIWKKYDARITKAWLKDEDSMWEYIWWQYVWKSLEVWRTYKILWLKYEESM
jgi:hypothetical protein